MRLLDTFVKYLRDKNDKPKCYASFIVRFQTLIKTTYNVHPKFVKKSAMMLFIRVYKTHKPIFI